MIEHIPVVDYTESKKRGRAERERLDRLIESCGGIVSYMTGPRYRPKEEPTTPRRENDTMKEYTEILGHEPDEKTKQCLDRLNAMADQFHKEHPDISMPEVWEILYEAACVVKAKRNQRSLT